ncbi:MAG: hypothetical protein Q4D06_08095 [Coriobacteriia bacterium]|nr:hypothetical protein [Coriobacteriia bacterium]
MSTAASTPNAPASPILAHLADPQTAVVFDVDGVLALYEFGPLQHAAEVEGDWEAYVRANDPYAAVPPAPPIQRFVAAKDPAKVFACSVAADYEEPGKRDFVLRHYSIPAQNVIMVREKAEKIAALERIAQEQGLEHIQVALVEDTVKTLDAAAAAGFSTCHVSSFLAW